MVRDTEQRRAGRGLPSRAPALARAGAGGLRQCSGKARYGSAAQAWAVALSERQPDGPLTLRVYGAMSLTHGEAQPATR
jgi:hypothetical protein